MEYPNSRTKAIPPGSPWRVPANTNEMRNTKPGTSSTLSQNGLKLPSLPKLGSNIKHSQPQSQQTTNLPHSQGNTTAQNTLGSQQNQFPQQGLSSERQQVPGQHQQQTNNQSGNLPQPTFAQIVQQAQQLPVPSKPPVKGVPNLQNLPKLSSNSNSASRANATPPNNETDTGAHILGSIQMMPKVTSSHGMSGLNTVLPGNINNESRSLMPANLTDLPVLQSLSISNNSNSDTGSKDPDFGGLKPLLKLIDSQDIERQSVVLGTNLNDTGINISNSSTRLSHEFASPWQELSKHPVIPDFRLPRCYTIDTVVPQQQKLQNFDEGALFYIFYTMPRDAMQEAAAVELTNRSWRYHKELKMWLTKDPMSEPVQTGNQEESGMYIFFDPTSWRKVKREYVLFYPDIAEFVSWKPFSNS
ncbi:CCR4-NOT core subunit [Starmerella bacillaris]|uniref:CCR4-NOT core subunit n=1 Tax=Starmerella bacillaris TaxID=1247836 RepID=A0AAV5RLT2_STABA|nr:CCR4-NOT core subunit [Starmerella bacillaris]